MAYGRWSVCRGQPQRVREAGGARGVGLEVVAEYIEADFDVRGGLQGRAFAPVVICGQNSLVGHTHSGFGSDHTHSELGIHHTYSGLGRGGAYCMVPTDQHPAAPYSTPPRPAYQPSAHHPFTLPFPHLPSTNVHVLSTSPHIRREENNPPGVAYSHGGSIRATIRTLGLRSTW